MENSGQIFSHFLIEKLKASGVFQYVVCPGSRNTPLSLAVAENSQVEKKVFFDERAAGFYALGLAKSRKKPAAIIVTSGTAVANLFPAVVEAFESKVPLLLLTADRPQMVKNTHANQTIDQEKFFGVYSRFYANIEVSENYKLEHLTQLVYQTTFHLQRPLPGPCHLNICFDEPLFEKDLSLTAPTKTIKIIEPNKRIFSEKLFLPWKEKGLILVGEEESENLPYILHLAEELNWPVVGDILSQLKTLPKHNKVIHYTEEFLSSELIPEIVLHFGERFVSKKLFQILQKTPPSFYAHIYPYPTCYNPYQLITDRYHCSSKEFCLSVESSFTSSDTWISLWEEKQLLVFSEVQLVEEFCEPKIVEFLSSYFPKDSLLFLGNSLPIRHADRMLLPNTNLDAIYANRGASGIDGNIATCLGLAYGKKKKVIAILGDITCLHDLTSLYYLKNSLYPVILVILNNTGGAIFDFLPVQKSKYLNTYFTNSHELTFEKIADAFSLSYEGIKTREDFAKVIKGLNSPSSCILEFFTSTKEGKSFYERIQPQKASTELKKIFT